MENEITVLELKNILEKFNDNDIIRINCEDDYYRICGVKYYKDGTVVLLTKS